jgi:hypothetical protein
MSLNPSRKILDFDFSFLDKLPIGERLPALLELSERGRTSWVDVAALIHAGDNPVIQEKAFPDIADPLARREAYWERLIPTHVRNDRRRISDYRCAIGTLIRYKDELETAGFDPYTDGSFTNILKLPAAIKIHSSKPEVFQNLVTMKTRPFAAYSRGEKPNEAASPSLKVFLGSLYAQRSALGDLASVAKEA